MADLVPDVLARAQAFAGDVVLPPRGGIESGSPDHVVTVSGVFFLNHPGVQQMKAQDQYLKFVRWEEADGIYVGYCPDLFPWGGVCHGKTEVETYHQLCALVLEEVEELRQAGKELPPASTRPMREAVPG